MLLNTYYFFLSIFNPIFYFLGELDETRSLYFFNVAPNPICPLKSSVIRVDTSFRNLILEIRNQEEYRNYLKKCFDSYLKGGRCLRIRRTKKIEKGDSEAEDESFKEKSTSEEDSEFELEEEESEDDEEFDVFFEDDDD